MFVGIWITIINETQYVNIRTNTMKINTFNFDNYKLPNEQN